MRLASCHRTDRFRRGQAIYDFILGLAMVALLLANVFLFLEYFGNFHGRNDVLDVSRETIREAEAQLQAFQRAEAQREAPEPGD